LRTRPFNPS